MTTVPEFSRRIRLDEIGSTPRSHAVVAEPEERAALASRFGLASLDRLDADIALSREAAGVRARGRVRAVAEQICVVSGEPVPAMLDEPVEVLFVFQAQADDADEDVELSSGDCDTLPLEGEAVDVGELAAETVSLALDPYPRLSDEALAQHRRLLMSEEEAEAQAQAEKATNNPFAVLKKKP